MKWAVVVSLLLFSIVPDIDQGELTIAVVELPISYAIGLTLLLSGTGTVFDNLALSRYEKKSQLIGNTGMSLIAGLLFFSVLRIPFQDSLQASCFSGLAGVYGRDYVGPIITSVCQFIGDHLKSFLELFGGRKNGGGK